MNLNDEPNTRHDILSLIPSLYDLQELLPRWVESTFCCWNTGGDEPLPDGSRPQWGGVGVTQVCSSISVLIPNEITTQYFFSLELCSAVTAAWLSIMLKSEPAMKIDEEFLHMPQTECPHLHSVGSNPPNSQYTNIPEHGSMFFSLIKVQHVVTCSFMTFMCQ